MIINRHNYEEYFLLYVDGELQPDERIAVEYFVSQNPDLSEELEILNQAILQNQEIVYREKEQLFKTETGVSLSNYQTYFLLYTDLELNSKEINEVERFVLQHPELQDDFTLIQKTKLLPERLVFADKKLLYRNKEERRIFPVFWMKMGVAAAIIVSMVFSWGIFQNYTTGSETQQVAVTNSPDKKVIERSTTNDAGNMNARPQINDILQSKLLARQMQKQSSLTLYKSKNKKINATKGNDQMKQIQRLPTKNYVEEQKQNLVKSGAENQVNNEEEIAIQSPNDNKNEITNETNNQKDVLIEARNRNFEVQPSLVSNTVYRELDTTDEERNLYIGSATINKNKIRSLFKKAARLFGKNTNESERF